MTADPSVLIIEDDLEVRELLEFNFETEGFEVISRDDGAEALEYLTNSDSDPDAIILDILLPEMDGMEFLRHCNQMNIASETPIIILTGLTDEDILAETYRLGADDYVTKPFSPSSLITRVTHLA